MNKTINTIALVGIMSLGLNTGEALATSNQTEILEQDTSIEIIEENIEPSIPIVSEEEKEEIDSIPMIQLQPADQIVLDDSEIEPDPGPMGEMGKPRPGEDWGDDDSEAEPDPGPMGEMGRPQPGEDWGDDDEEICPNPDNTENENNEIKPDIDDEIEPDIDNEVEPNPGPMGQMGRPQSPEEEEEWENPKTGDASFVSSLIGLATGGIGIVASRRKR